MNEKRVMIIDDNEIDNFITSLIIKKSEFSRRIVTMTSALAALERLHNIDPDSDEFPDLIFLDIRMPVMDGFQFLDEFLKFPAKARDKCSIVMLTSSSDTMDVQRALKYPVVKKFLDKPLRENMLKELQ